MFEQHGFHFSELATSLVVKVGEFQLISHVAHQDGSTTTSGVGIKAFINDGIVVGFHQERLIFRPNEIGHTGQFGRRGEPLIDIASFADELIEVIGVDCHFNPHTIWIGGCLSMQSDDSGHFLFVKERTINVACPIFNSDHTKLIGIRHWRFATETEASG